MGLKKKSTNMGPPWMKGSKHIQGVPMIIVRMNIPELEGLDNLQGFVAEDPNTGIRAYPRLAEIIENPQVQEFFQTAFSNAQKHGHISKDLKEAYDIVKQHAIPYQETPEEQHNPYIKSLEEQGPGEDKKFAYLPINFVEFLIKLHGKPDISPEGLFSFAFWKEFVRFTGTIAGALFGGPLGAGIGNAAARAVTGSSLPNALLGGFKTGALAYGAQGLGQAAGLSAATPYSGGFFGGAPNMLATGLGAMGVGNAAAAAPAAAKTISAASVGLPVGVAAPHTLQAQAAAAAAAQQAAQQSSGIMGSLANVAPWGMMGLSYLSDKQNHKFLENKAREERERYEREKEQLGYSPNWKPVMSKRYVENPEFYKVSKEDMKHGIFPSPFIESPRQEYAKGGLVKSYTKGSLIKGPGKGQDDEIKTSVPDRSYIIDASSTSTFGDGSSEAGYKVLKRFERQIMERAPKRLVQSITKHISKTSKPVPVYLSNDEVLIPPVPVTVLGAIMCKGSNKEGADVLRHMVNNARKHNASNGSGLPPKAKDPWDYIKQRRA